LLVQFGLFACASQQGGGETEEPIVDDVQNLEENDISQREDESKNADDQLVPTEAIEKSSTVEQSQDDAKESAVGWNSEVATTPESKVMGENENMQSQNEDYSINNDKPETQEQESPDAIKPVNDRPTPSQDLFAVAPLPQLDPDSNPTEQAAAPDNTESSNLEAKSSEIDQVAQVKNELSIEETQTTPEPKAPGKSEVNIGKKPYMVMPGDTLASIAQEIYGSAAKWKSLAVLNSLKNPNRLYPGDLIYFEISQETQGFSDAMASTTQKTVKVEKGDSLSSISQKLLGSANYWKTIWKLNQDKISDPHKIQAGTQLVYYEFKKVATKDPKRVGTNRAH
jgi:nucleoid-associated protein YgaU